MCTIADQAIPYQSNLNGKIHVGYVTMLEVTEKFRSLSRTAMQVRDFKTELQSDFRRVTYPCVEQAHARYKMPKVCSGKG